uniref:CUT domain-containing protein n=1 Tax=Globodera pallida TaxID=36090 RepID=A0A183CJ37_GLOPA
MGHHQRHPPWSMPLRVDIGTPICSPLTLARDEQYPHRGRSVHSKGRRPIVPSTPGYNIPTTPGYDTGRNPPMQNLGASQGSYPPPNPFLTSDWDTMPNMSMAPGPLQQQQNWDRQQQSVLQQYPASSSTEYLGSPSFNQPRKQTVSNSGRHNSAANASLGQWSNPSTYEAIVKQQKADGYNYGDYDGELILDFEFARPADDTENEDEPEKEDNTTGSDTKPGGERVEKSERPKKKAEKKVEDSSSEVKKTKTAKKKVDESTRIDKKKVDESTRTADKKKAKEGNVEAIQLEEKYEKKLKKSVEQLRLSLNEQKMCSLQNSKDCWMRLFDALAELDDELRYSNMIQYCSENKQQIRYCGGSNCPDIENVIVFKKTEEDEVVIEEEENDEKEEKEQKSEEQNDSMVKWELPQVHHNQQQPLNTISLLMDTKHEQMGQQHSCNIRHRELSPPGSMVVEWELYQLDNHTIISSMIIINTHFQQWLISRHTVQRAINLLMECLQIVRHMDNHNLTMFRIRTFIIRTVNRKTNKSVVVAKIVKDMHRIHNPALLFRKIMCKILQHTHHNGIQDAGTGGYHDHGPAMPRPVHTVPSGGGRQPISMKPNAASVPANPRRPKGTTRQQQQQQPPPPARRGSVSGPNTVDEYDFTVFNVNENRKQSSTTSKASSSSSSAKLEQRKPETVEEKKEHMGKHLSMYMRCVNKLLTERAPIGLIHAGDSTNFLQLLYGLLLPKPLFLAQQLNMALNGVPKDQIDNPLLMAPKIAPSAADTLPVESSMSKNVLNKLSKSNKQASNVKHDVRAVLEIASTQSREQLKQIRKISEALGYPNFADAGKIFIKHQSATFEAKESIVKFLDWRLMGRAVAPIKEDYSKKHPEIRSAKADAKTLYIAMKVKV